MNKNLIRSMPADQVNLCTANNICISARGENAKTLVAAVTVVLFCVAAYYLSKIE